MTKEEIIAAFVILECKPGCPPEEVKSSYRELVKVWHPDRFDSDPKLKIKATEKMKSINDAYRLLERFFAAIQSNSQEEQRTNTSTESDASPSSSRAQSREGKYEVGSEQVKITKERDPKSRHAFFKKVIETVTGYNGRWLSTQTKVFTTKPVDSGDNFESASNASMSFSMKPEQGRRGAHSDYGGGLGENECEGTGNEYFFPDGSSVYVANVSRDTWFHDDDKKAAHGRASASLESMEEAYQVFKKRRDWSACVEIAQRAVELHGQNSWGWTQRSFALHCLKRTREAFDLLKPAAKMFPDKITVFYNLACYAAQLGNADEAKVCLKSVFELAEKGGPYGWQFERYRDMALQDPDLVSVRSNVPHAPFSWKVRKYFGV